DAENSGVGGPVRVSASDMISGQEEGQRLSGGMHFGTFRMDLRGGRLLRGSENIPLRPKTWAVLRYLADRPGQLVTRRELIDAVWGRVAITESVLGKSIAELRTALADGGPRLIETVTRRGFRFLGNVTPAEAASVPENGGRPAVSPYAEPATP